MWVWLDPMLFALAATLVTRPAAAASVPTFSWRCQLQGLSPTGITPGATPPESLMTSWVLGGTTVRSNGSAWSSTGNFTGEGITFIDSTAIPTAVLAPMTVSSSPTSIGTDGMLSMVVVEVTLSAGQVLTLHGQLYGARLALLLSTVNSTGPTAVVQTMADFNAKRYGDPAQGIRVSTPPKMFPIMDRFIGALKESLYFVTCCAVYQ